MATVITVAQRKGGAGKTTLCCQLSAALLALGYRVAGIDLDDQGSFSYWAKNRHARFGQEARWRFEAPKGYALHAALRRARGAADFIIIDTAPVADYTVKRAVGAADLVLSPLQLTPLDLAASLPTARLVAESGRPARFVVNRTPPRARIADLIREQIKKHKLPMLDGELGNRAAFAESLSRGLGVVESEPSSLAAEEARRLARAVMACAGRSLEAA